MTKRKLSEVDLPGVENDPAPRGIILHLFPASQLPYSAKIQKIRNFGAGWPPPLVVGEEVGGGGGVVG